MFKSGKFVFEVDRPWRGNCKVGEFDSLFADLVGCSEILVLDP